MFKHDSVNFALPDRYLITGDDPTQPELFLARLESALANGLRLVQLRAPDLSESEFKDLAVAVLEMCHHAGARVLLNSALRVAEMTDCTGVHLNSHRLMQLTERPLGGEYLVAASCHNREELAHAECLGLDFAVLSPVLPTFSHPEATPLGWPDFAALVAAVSLPVYALGGMCEELLPEAIEQGAQGIAGISWLWVTNLRSH